MITSDNALQFKLVKSTIDVVWEDMITNKVIKSYAAEHGIKWHFIIERAPWMGGFYERLVKNVK
jgi:hypothetical protein